MLAAVGWGFNKQGASLALAVITHLAVATIAAGQQVQVDSIVVHGPDDTGVPAETLDDLEQRFRAGEFEEARKRARQIIDGAAHRTASDAYRYSSHVLAVLWPGIDAAGNTVLRRMMVSRPGAHPASLDLPGLSPDGGPPHLYEVLLTLDQRSALTSEYTFTREEHPLTAQLPSVAEALATPLFGFISAVTDVAAAGAGQRRVAEEPKRTVWARASRVPIAFLRALVKVRSVARLPITTEAWKEEVNSLERHLLFQLVSRSKPARTCATRYAKAALRTPKQDACVNSKGDCREAFDRAFSAAYEECVADAQGASQDDAKALAVVDNNYRELVADARASKVEAQAEFRNVPRSHFSFGLGTGLILGASLGEDRVKLDDSGNLVRDPLPRQMTMLMLLWSPLGYDAAAPRMQGAERWRLFVAGMLTPDIGAAVGGSMMIVRGLGLNLGGGVVFSKAASSGDEIGHPPSSSTDPFGVSTGWVAFAGINFVFK
jgi:hypothetical protein